MMDHPGSFMFVDNTKDGMLAKMLQAKEKPLSEMTSYIVRIAESAGMALSRLLPSTKEIVAARIVSSVASMMRNSRIAEKETSCMRTELM